MRQREPRQRSERFLAFLRLQPCCVCGKPPPCEAAHIRMHHPEIGKQSPGMQSKPHDFHCTPLCPACHREQHGKSERAWWTEKRRNPFEIALRLYLQFLSEGGPEAKSRGPRKTKPRKPPHLRKKIQNRKFGT